MFFFNIFESANSGTFLLYNDNNLLSSLLVQSFSKICFFETFVKFFFVILLFIAISLIYSVMLRFDFAGTSGPGNPFS